MYKALGAAQADPPFETGRRHGDLPAVVDLAERVVDGHLDVIEENLGKAGLPVELGDRPHRDAL